MVSEHPVLLAVRDAERFRYLQNCSPIEAQAYFWNYTSRKQRAKAIDEAIKDSLMSPTIVRRQQ